MGASGGKAIGGEDVGAVFKIIKPVKARPLLGPPYPHHWKGYWHCRHRWRQRRSGGKGTLEKGSGIVQSFKIIGTGDFEGDIISIFHSLEWTIAKYLVQMTRELWSIFFDEPISVESASGPFFKRHSGTT
jgi:hypothetical protein